MNLVNFNARHVDFLSALRNSCLAGLLLLGANFTFAQDAATAVPASSSPLTPDGLTARYPSGSIQSTDTANRALLDVERQRAMLEQKYAAEQHICYSKFLATSCLDAAKESRRLALARIRKVEVEANSFIRGARVVERDKHLAEKRATETSNPPNPPKPVTEPPAKQAAQPAAEGAANGEQRVIKHDAKLRRQQRAEQDDAQKRAEDVAAFDKKASDAAVRQRDVAAKKAEKERQAAAKAAAASAATKP